MRSIFPANIDGDLLKLVHLSNGFKMFEGASPLKASDVCKSEARIVSVVNSPGGKAVTVKGHVSRLSQPIIKVVSSFLYCSRFTDYKNNFETTEEPNYLVPRPIRVILNVTYKINFSPTYTYLWIMEITYGRI